MRGFRLLKGILTVIPILDNWTTDVPFDSAQGTRWLSGVEASPHV